jgi:hypothetical protein
MDNLDRVYHQIKTNYERRREGKFNAIPFPFGKLNKAVPGIIPGLHYLVTADTKVGKSRFARQTFVMHPYEWAKKNNYEVEILYFPLEDSADRVIKMLICFKMFVKYGIEISVEMLDSMGQEVHLNDVLLSYLDDCKDEIRQMLREITVMDTITSPRGMYNYIQNRLDQNGYVEFEILNEGTGEEQRVPLRYIKKTEKHFIIVVDNLNNITPEAKHSNQRLAIDEWTEFYTRKWLCNFFGCTVVNIQQQAPASAQHQYSNTGQLIVEKLMPSISGLGDNKATAQTAHVIMGLFSPYRHKIGDSSAFGCNVARMKDFYRHLRIIASNIGESPVDMGLFFDGLTEKFAQLPTEREKLEEMYTYITGLEQKRGLVGNIQGNLLGAFADLM